MSDAGGGSNASATLGAVAGLLDGVADPALALAAASLTAAAGGNTAVSQSSSTLSLLGSAPSQTYTLTFSWASSATSSRDEAAVRLGVAGGVNNASADNYPGVGGRTASADGHFVSVGVTLLSVPEPSALALLATMLALLALRPRRRPSLSATAPRA